MAFARVKTWIVEKLKAAELNAEFDNVLNILNTDVVLKPYASAAEILAGTEAAKAIAPDQLAVADLNTRLKSKVIQATRDLSAATGDVSYTGVGFMPTAMVQMSGLGADIVSFGFVDSVKGSLNMAGGSSWATATGTVGSTFLYYQTAGGAYQTATIKTYNADGFTLSWVKTGLPAGTLSISILCFR